MNNNLPLDPDEELQYAVRLGLNEALYSGILDYMHISHQEVQSLTDQIVDLFKTNYPHCWRQLVGECYKRNNGM